MITPTKPTVGKKPTGGIRGIRSESGEISLESSPGSNFGPVSVAVEPDGSIGLQVKIPTPAPGLGVIAGIEINPITGEIESTTGGITVGGVIDVTVTIEGCEVLTLIEIETPFGISFGFGQKSTLPGCEEPPPPPPPPPPGDFPPLGPDGLPPGLPPPNIEECPSISSEGGWCLYEFEVELKQTIRFPTSKVISRQEVPFPGPVFVYKTDTRYKEKIWFKNATSLKKDVYPPEIVETYGTTLWYGGAISGEIRHYVCASQRAAYREGYNTQPFWGDIGTPGEGKYYIFNYNYVFTKGKYGGVDFTRKAYSAPEAYTLLDYENDTFVYPNWVYPEANYSYYYTVDPAYKYQDRLIVYTEDSNGDLQVSQLEYTYMVQEGTIKGTLIQGSCFVPPETPPDNPPSPPPPPLPPLPPYMNCCGQLQQSNHALIRMVREIHKSLRADMFGQGIAAKVPEGMVRPGKNGIINLNDYVDVFEFLLRTIDRYLGKPPWSVFVEDTDPNTEGNQSLTFRFESIGEMLKSLLETEANKPVGGGTGGSASVPESIVSVRTVFEIAIAILFEMGITHKLVAEIRAEQQEQTEALGYKVNDKVETIKFAFSPLAKALEEATAGSEEELQRVIPQMLQPSMVNIKYSENEDERTLYQLITEVNDLLKSIRGAFTSPVQSYKQFKGLMEGVEFGMDAAQLILLRQIRQALGNLPKNEFQDFMDNLEKRYTENQSPVASDQGKPFQQSVSSEPVIVVQEQKGGA